MPTLDEAIRDATGALARAGVDTPGVDARRLLCAATGRSRAELMLHADEAIEARDLAKLERFVSRRCAREPVSRILGEREFYGRSFSVTPATLDPRADSETVVEAVLEIVRQGSAPADGLRILDIGTGSGALLVTLLAELPDATGLGTDTSREALEIAAVNARRHGVADRARFARHDALEGLEDKFDIVVSNPPYIPSGEIARLEPEVRNFDPRGALDGGADGLSVYRKIIPRLAQVLACGWVAFEVGAGQASAVAEMLRALAHGPRAGAIRVRKDLGGHERCVAMEIQW